MAKSSLLYENDCSKYNISIYIGKLIAISIFIVIIISLNNLEHSNCKCADLPYRKYLKEWFIFTVIYSIAILMIFVSSNHMCWRQFRNQPYIYGIILVFTFIHIIMLIRLFLYVRTLRDNCKCGYGNKEQFIYWYLIVVFSIWVAIIVLVFIAILSTIIKFMYN